MTIAVTNQNRFPVLAANLGTEINDTHALAQQHAGEAIKHALRCGELLIEAKAKVPHGQWLPWLRQNIAFSDRTAQGYMRIAQRVPRQIRNGVADLSVRGVLQDLATPRKHAMLDDFAAWSERTSAISAKRPAVTEWSIDDARACIDNIREFDVILHRYGLCEGDDPVGCLVCDALKMPRFGGDHRVVAGN